MDISSKQSTIDYSKMLQGVVIIIGVAFFSYFLAYTEFAEGLGLKLYDFNFQMRGAKSIENPDVVIVAIDELTTDSLAFPFDRIIYAQLIRKLNKLGAKTIVLDIQFSSIGAIPESDSVLHSAIAEAKNVILAGKIALTYHAGLREPLIEPKPPVKQVMPEGTPWGVADEIVDQDGVTRKYSLFRKVEDVIYFSLGLETYAFIHHLGQDDLSYESTGPLKIGDLIIPRTEVESCLLNYYGPTGTFPTYSLIDVIAGEYDFDDLLAGLSPEEAELLAASGMADLLGESPFQDKIVILGATAEDLQDNKFTPFFNASEKRRTPGAEVHANAIQMFHDRAFIDRIDVLWIRFAVIIISIIMFFNGLQKYQWLAVIVAISIISTIVVGNIYLFTKQNLWIQIMPVLLSASIGYPANLVYRFILAQRDKAMIQGMFGKYLPEKVVEALVGNPDLAKLGGEERRMTVMFTDVAGFTSISEQLVPHELVVLLNEYLTAMSNIIQENEGIIDKYAGDLIMAEFGAPLWFEEHASYCCRAALKMQAKLVEMREAWASEERPVLHSRIGINTGNMIVGNMGSDTVFDYTVMGDSVNLSSRLEGANKNYDTTIMIGYETWKDVKDKFVTRHLDYIRVKGKTEPVEVFELISETTDELTPSKLQALKVFRKGLDLFRDRKFSEANAYFLEAALIDHQDGPTKLYIERCEELIANPPDKKWDGAYTLTEK